MNVGSAQLVCWQLALVGAGVGSRQPAPVGIPVVSGAVLLVLLTSVRYRSQWAYEWLARAGGYLFRHRRQSLREATDRSLRLLGAVSGRTWSRSVAEIGLLADADGMTAVLRPAAPGRVESLPPPRLLLEAVEQQPVPLVAQTVVHTGIRPGQPRVWFAVRTRRTADVATDADVGTILANAVRRVVRQLDRLGMPCEALDRQDLLATVSAVAHVNGRRDQLAESWTGWSAGPVTQAVFRLAGYERLPRASAGLLLGHLLRRRHPVATTIAITGWSGGAEAVVRIAATSTGFVDAAHEDLDRIAGDFGVRLERLDGRHGAGLAASLPLAIPTTRAGEPL